MIALHKTSVQPTKLQKPNTESSNLQQVTFLQEVIEGLQDGILILTETGELVYANSNARSICFSIQQANSNENFILLAIWKLCKSLLNSHSLLTNKNLVVSDEIILDNTTTFRIRVRWLDLEKNSHPLLLITIENRYESVRNAALAEIKKYQLTPREAEIWLLYRAKYTYKKIADELYITLNTVKKHMKNIHAKRNVEVVGR